jgi:hypothetical protein
MKILKVSRLCVGGALILAIIIAWFAIMPKRLALCDVIGGWDCDERIIVPCNGPVTCTLTMWACDLYGDSGICNPACFYDSEGEYWCHLGCKYGDEDCTQYVVHARCDLIV